MAIIRSSFDTTSNKDLFKSGSLRSIFDTTVREAKVFYPRLVNDLKSKDDYERIQRMAGLTLPTEVSEGQNIPIGTPTIGGSKTYTQRRFGGGFRMTHYYDYFNKIDHWKKLTKDLGKLQKEAKDIEIAVMWNNPTSTTLTCGTGFDSMAIANVAHTGLASGTSDNYNNYGNAALSYTALETARYYFATLVDDMGNFAGATPDTLSYQPTLWPTVKEMFGSDLKAQELSNTKNWLPEWGIKPFEYPRYTATTRWMVHATKDPNYGFNVFTAMEPIFVVRDAPDSTLDKLCLSLQYFDYGWHDARLTFVGI